MTFTVYKAIRSGRRFKNWEFASRHDTLAAAEKAAEDLCPKGEEIETEPGLKIDRAFFGSAQRDTWSARIEPDQEPLSQDQSGATK